MTVTNAPLRARRALGKGRPWPRSRRRAWTRPNDLASAPALFAAIPSLPRHELSRLTVAMIDRMDELDGDPDAEDGYDTEEERYE